jgi:hypothetical protein
MVEARLRDNKEAARVSADIERVVEPAAIDRALSICQQLQEPPVCDPAGSKNLTQHTAWLIAESATSSG